MTKYLGIDYGDRRVGLALADAEVPIAFPYDTIDREKTDLWHALQEIIDKEKIKTIILGMPYHPDGRKDGKNLDVEAFAQKLKQKTNLPIYYQDESYSSVSAKTRTQHLKKRQKRDKGRIDRAAATIILQNWLDENL
ncbi:MAG: Holliday junction resolvase RuvX [Fibrobacter sp.]|nr:Holliday junction resolvase RuvX [Fibrobacter sp.]